MARIIVRKGDTLAERENIEKSIKRLRFEMDMPEKKNGKKTRAFDQLVLIRLSVAQSSASGRTLVVMHKLAQNAHRNYCILFVFGHSGTLDLLIAFLVATAAAIQS